MTDDLDLPRLNTLTYKGKNFSGLETAMFSSKNYSVF